MVFRITMDDITRSSSLDKSDWNKYAILVNGTVSVIGSKKEAEKLDKEINT